MGRSGHRWSPAEAEDIDRIVAELGLAEAKDHLEHGGLDGRGLAEATAVQPAGAAGPYPPIYRAYAKAKETGRNGLPPEKRKPLAERIVTLQSEDLRLRTERTMRFFRCS